MSEIALYCIIFISSVFLASVSQIILKISAKKQYPCKIKEYLNPHVITAYIMFFSCTFVSVYCLRVLPLNYLPILESSGYIFVAVMSYFILKEKLSRKKIMGLVLILIGIEVYVGF